MFDTEVYLTGDKNSVQSFKGTEGDDLIIFDNLFINKANAGEPRFNSEVRNNNRKDFNNLPDFSQQYTNPNGFDSTDILFSRPGADAFKFDFTLWGPKFIREQVTHKNEGLDKRWLGGRNDFYHAHYSESIGNDYIVNFSNKRGDVLILDGHDIDYTVLYSDELVTTLGIYSDHGRDRYYSNNAHDGDVLGTIAIIGELDLSSVYIVDTFV